MLYDQERLKSYVRFYLTVVTQLSGALDNLVRIQSAVKEAVLPFAPALSRLASPALTAALAPANGAKEALGELFRPEDREGLTGLTDIYEVVGRFSFQGEGNKNLARVQALVSTARNEIVAQRERIAQLSQLPAEARTLGAHLRADEEAQRGALCESKTAAFEPLAQQVSVRAEQTIAAMRAVPFPDLASAEAATGEYKRFVGKLEQVYQTCLPFLRKAISNLYSFVACEPGASWPDALPLVEEMPAELVTVPPADSAELSQARANLKELALLEVQLGKARDEIATTMARLEGEIAALQVKDKEFELLVGTKGQVVEFVSMLEQADSARSALPVLEQQRAERVHAAGEVWQRQRKLEASIKLLEDDKRARSQEIDKLSEQVTALKGDEPVLFGKDAWRTRVTELEGQIEERKATLLKRLGSLNQLKIELSAISVQVQTEETQRGLVDRQLAEHQAKLAALDKGLRELGATLGVERPARKVPLAEAVQALSMLQQERQSLGQRLSKMREEVRSRTDEGLSIALRLKQIGIERQHMQAMVESAQVAATSGREEALRQLAVERRAAVERHVSEVLGNLEKSLGQVSLTFIEPAREAMLKSVEPKEDVAAAMLESAEAIAKVVEKLSLEFDAQLLAQDAALSQIQREFCDVAVDACRAAWG